MIQAHILLGGLWGWDGIVTSRGMLGLAKMLAKIPGVQTHTYYWSGWQNAAAAIEKQPKSDKTVLIGYSGGGSRATWLSRYYPAEDIDLMVLYDPSPKWQMLPITNNVTHAISYENERPLMFGLGGGVLSVVKGYAGKIEVVPVKEQHLLVQYDQALHAKTIAEIEFYAKLDALKLDVVPRRGIATTHSMGKVAT